MAPKNLSEFTDEELLKESQKNKSKTVINALLIGFLIGVIFYSVVKNTYGFLTIIPLFLAYKLINKSKHDEQELERILKERNLK